MNNYINFYYELYPDNIVKNKDNYTFVINNVILLSIIEI